jgi:glutamyl-tRNA synthetase
MDNEIITRFAPSPTGFLHLGSARTALYNFLFARKHQGKFILRIEDTDKERSRPEYIDDIVKSLKWLGLDFDEVVKQSERTKMYKDIIDELLQKDKAYRCFCSKEELEAKRQEQILRGETPVYSGICRNLSQDKINANLNQDVPYVIRIKITVQKLSFSDLLRGNIEILAGQIGDFVIAKSETEPLFYLATPVDDHFQAITHIIRGADHISNAFKQILVFKAMNWSVPVFAHIPLILGDAGGKLSKRQGAKSIREYKQEGYLPEALLNFMLHLGWHSKTDREIFSFNEMIDAFELERIQKKAAMFNHSKLLWLNKYFIRKKPAAEILTDLSRTSADSETGQREIISNYVSVENDLYQAQNGLIYNREQMLKIIELGKERAQTLNDILPNVKFFFWDFDYEKELLVWKNYSLAEIKTSLEKVESALKRLNEQEFNEEKLKEILDSLHSDKGLSYFPLRVALTGLQSSPPPIEIAIIFGKTYTLKLINKAIQK